MYLLCTPCASNKLTQSGYLIAQLDTNTKEAAWCGVHTHSRQMRGAALTGEAPATMQQLWGNLVGTMGQVTTHQQEQHTPLCKARARSLHVPLYQHVHGSHQSWAKGWNIYEKFSWHDAKKLAALAFSLGHIFLHELFSLWPSMPSFICLYIVWRVKKIAKNYEKKIIVTLQGLPLPS